MTPPMPAARLIDDTLLADALAVSRSRPDRRSIAAPPAIAPPPSLAADAALPETIERRLKERLRALPLLGPALVSLNGWLKRHRVAERLDRTPIISQALRWLKAAILLGRTRHRVEGALRVAGDAQTELSRIAAELSVLEQRTRVSNERERLDDLVRRVDRLTARIDRMEQQRRGD